MEKIVQRERCTLIYEYSEWETDFGPASALILKKCIPKDGVYLFEIQATYAKKVPPSTYYFLGTSNKDVKERFNHCMGSWMNITGIRLIPPGEEAEKILSTPTKIPVS